MQQFSLKKTLLLVLGSISLALGVIGVLLPVLPTTPFMLLAAFCYLRSSRRLYDWLINHRVFGTYIYNYMTYRAVTRKTKFMALFFLWLTLIISIVIVDNLHLGIFLAAVGVGVSIHLLHLKTISLQEMVKKPEKPE
jgi:uncharacterized membrane protein YbaN (DUF454 family)